MFPTKLLALIFQAAQNDSVARLRDFIHKSGGLPITIRILAQCNEHGESPLNIAIKSGHHNVVEFLITQLKEHKDVFGSEFYLEYVNEKINGKHQPAEIANILGISDKVPVLYIMEYLINPAVDDISWLILLLDCVIVSTITRPEKIVALELLGAAFIFQTALSLPNDLEGSSVFFRNMLPLRRNPKDNDGYFMGVKCWKDALALRKATDDDEPALPKIPCDLPDICRNFFGVNVNEFVTSDQLEQLEEQLVFHTFPENGQFLSGIHGPLIVQALLVIQRIFHQSPNVLYLKFWLKYGLNCLASKEYSRSFDVIFFIVNQIVPSDPMPPPRCIPIFLITLHQMSKYFVETHETHMESLKHSRRETAKLTDLLTVIKVSVNRAKHLQNQLINKEYEMNRVLEYFRLDNEMDVLFEMYPDVKRRDRERLLRDHVYDYSRGNNLENKSFFNPLIVVVSRLFWSVNRMNKAVIQIIELLLAIGFDPNATNSTGENPIHYLAKQWSIFRLSSNSHRRTVFLSLLDAGGNLDQKSRKGKTVRDVLKERNKLLYQPDPFMDSLINVTMPYSTLCQLCARVIRQQGIPFEDKLPPRLQSFVLCRRI